MWFNSGLKRHRRPVCVASGLDVYQARAVALRVQRLGAHLAQGVDAPGRADLVVEGHQQVAEAYHAGRDQRELGEQLAVLLAERHFPSNQYLAMMPRKKASAMVASTR